MTPRNPPSTPQASLHSAPLVRFLAERELLQLQPAQDNVGERLGQWLDFRQAITLHKLLGNEGEQPTWTAPGRAVADAQAVRAHVDKTRSALNDAVVHAKAVPGTPRIPMPADAPELPIQVAQAWEPYRRYCSTHQRQMETVIGTLRTQVRATVAHASAPLQQLALLDAAYEQALSERESRLLASLPAKMELRFVQLLQAAPAEAAAPEPGAADKPARHKTPPPPAKAGWLLQFEDELRQALLAELDLRLQPVLGLVDAYTQHTT